jgi:acyl-coenzyme A synthetase/AMP-(fatty) acid ligase
MATQKWPEELHEVDDFPRTASGKVQKFLVRQNIALSS